MINNKANSILAIIDGSYWNYFTVFSAISDYLKKCSLEASILIKDAETVDQDNLPDLLVSEDFRRILKNTVMRKCEVLDWYLHANFLDQIDSADEIDFVFALDDFLKNNFRKELYPEYKALRKLVKKSFDMYKIHNYIYNVLFPELNVEEKYGYRFVKVDGAEGDDVIATIARNLSKDYMLTVLFASDRDFVQLDGIHLMTLFGKEVECKIGDEIVSRDEYLGVKILIGDASDNIAKVFDRVGPKKALKLIRDKLKLKAKLNESLNAAKQFLLNKQLISFSEIPKELNDRILEKVNLALYREKALTDSIDFKNFMTL